MEQNHPKQGGVPMPAALIKRLSNLLCVKSIVTLILTVVFADLAVSPATIF